MRSRTPATIRSTLIVPLPELRSTWYSAPGESSFNGIDATFVGVETYVGGTRRFANVSGSSRVEGTAHLDMGEYTSERTIAY